jgi:hypothetical protein
MHTAHLWHLYPLRSKKIILPLALLALLASESLAQGLQTNKKNFYGINQGDYEHRRMHYGFFLALHSTTFRIQHSDLFVPTNPPNADSSVAITPKNIPGFGLGILMNYRFARYFSVRVLPTVSFYNREIQYRFAGGFQSSQTKESTNIELPILLKYQSERRDNIRMYLVAGIKASIEANTKKKEGAGERLSTSNKDLAIEYGAGFDLFYEFVKFSPEIRFSHGLLNLLDRNRINLYNAGLNRVSTHTVSLYLHFE